MPAYGVAVGVDRWGRASLEHGTDDEPTKAGDEGHGDAVSVGVAGGKAKVLEEELRELTGWHRDHARKALREALGPQRVLAPRKAQAPLYGDDVLVALRKVWAVFRSRCWASTLTMGPSSSTTTC
jgi:hypothetical protein